jgi:hypothetical protein
MQRSGRRRALGASPLALVAALALLAGGCGAGGARFAHTFASPRELAAAVLEALSSQDRPALESLALTETEFREEVFPEMPAWGRIPMGYVWNDLRQKSTNELSGILAYHGGRSYSVEAVVFDGGATAYRTFVVHRKPRLVVRERTTRERMELALFGSVIEFGGRFKLFSYVVNR